MTSLPFTRLGRLSLGLLLGAPLAAKGQSVHAVLFPTPPPPPAVDDMRLLRAIAEVETGTTNLSHPCRKVGKAGERSAFQIKEATWRRYTHVPFSHASTDARLAHLVAALHLQQLRVMCETSKWRFSAYNLAWLWNCNPNGFLRDNYSDRVRNLYEDISRP